MGHLKRMLSLYKEMKAEAFVELFIPCDTIPVKLQEIIENYADPDTVFYGALPEKRRWDFIVVDKKETEHEEWVLLLKRGILLGLDEGGSRRSSFHFLIDTLPVPPGFSGANMSDPLFLDLPELQHRKIHSKSDTGTVQLRLLISFGGEDPGNLTEKLAWHLIRSGLSLPGNITIVEGPFFSPRNYPDHIEILKAPQSLKDILYRYDIVFTSFGITAYEAAAAGVYVILFNPTKYHRKLSRQAGFLEIGVNRILKRRLRDFMRNPDKIPIPFSLLQHDSPVPTLSAFILSLEIPERVHCPVCGDFQFKAKERFVSKTFFTCSTCGIDFLINFSSGRDSYRKEYFFSEYEKQYGKSYLDDFDNIRRIAVSRLKTIFRIEQVRKLLDVGCAYGPFLKEAVKLGIESSGIEIVREAADYVIRNLHIPVICGSFEQVGIGEKYDVVTMWYVIEHFMDLQHVLIKVNRILITGGIFAFSTPNSSGITGRNSRKRFFEQSPEDHFTVWNPASAKRILSMFGFKVVKIRITGHHPERFPGVLKGTAGIKRKIVFLFSRIFKLGDTFEVYAVKKKEYSL